MRKGIDIMTREEVYEKLNEVFQDVFDDEELTVDDDTVAGDVEGWDSLMHITLIDSIEDEFDIKLSMKTVVHAKNVGELVDAILEEVE